MWEFEKKVVDIKIKIIKFLLKTEGLTWIYENRIERQYMCI